MLDGILLVLLDGISCECILRLITSTNWTTLGLHFFGKVFSNKASHMRSANMYECRIIQRVVYRFKERRSHFLIYM